MSTSSDSIEAARTDYGLPGNDLNPKTPTAEQLKTIPLIVRVYGGLRYQTDNRRQDGHI